MDDVLLGAKDARGNLRRLAEPPKSPKPHLATSSSRAVSKMAKYRPALILSYRDYMFNDFDYSEAVKMIYSGRGPGRTTTSAAKLSR